MKRSWLFLSFVFVAALAACNGGGNSNPNVNPINCTPPSPTQYALVYPAPGSTAIPDQFGQIIVATSTALPSSWDVVTSTINGNTAGSTFVPVNPPFPTPNATPSFANPVYQSSSFGTAVFGSNEVVNVYLNDLGSNCSPLGPIGSFTTQ